MKIWISKYALTQGIYLEARAYPHSKQPSVAVVQYDNGILCCYFKGEWHETEQAAKDKAEEMRKKKILWHKKQIQKLEKLEF